jgi:hypothetical protein
LGGHSYTGLLDGGFDEAIMRFSEADLLVPESPGLAPSFAMKVLVSDRKSVNVLTRVDFEPSDSWNFWANTFKHRVQKPFRNECKKKTIERKFQFAEAPSTFNSFETGISELTTHE